MKTWTGKSQASLLEKKGRYPIYMRLKARSPILLSRVPGHELSGDDQREGPFAIGAGGREVGFIGNYIYFW
jgi:hypothetical protein